MEHHRRQGRGKDQRTAVVDQIVTDILAAENKGADGGIGLAEGPHQQIDLIDHPLLFRLAESLCAIETDGMGLIHIEQGIIFLFQLQPAG